MVGANKPDAHFINANYPRDFDVDLMTDIALAQPGHLCPQCRTPLEATRGVEVGHIFKLGTSYSEALGAMYLDQEGQQRPITMGCYGIGVGRLLAAAIEQNHDNRGIVFPAPIAPYQVHLVGLNLADETVAAAADKPLPGVVGQRHRDPLRRPARPGGRSEAQRRRPDGAAPSPGGQSPQPAQQRRGAERPLRVGGNYGASGRHIRSGAPGPPVVTVGGNSPGLRPLTIFERHYAWMYGLLPAGLVYALLVVITYFITRPDVGLFSYYMRPSDATLPIHGVNVPVDVHWFLARAFYLFAYFTWGRSTGHLVVGAHVIDRRTGRRMNSRQKLVRGLVQVLGGSMYVVLDGISLILILLDREERRSVYDWLSGTVVVVGDLPPEEETVPSRSWVAGLVDALRGRPAGERQ